MNNPKSKLTEHNPFYSDRAFVGGTWLAAKGGSTVPVTNPATGEIVGHVPQCGRAETEDAIAAAREAFADWAARPAKERGRILLKLADMMRAHQEELAQLLTLEQGKSLAEARGEIAIGADYLHWFSEEATRINGDVIPSPWTDRRILVMKEPVGVVAAITPWNFPSSMIARKMGPALATGCTIVIKPAAQTPLSALAYGHLCKLAGIPDGVVNIVTGKASDIGDAMVESPHIAKLSFTGSTAIGRMLSERCGGQLKRVSMELGGNAPFIVFDDADLDRAVDAAIAAKYRNSGQTCICVNRFFLQRNIHDTFVAKFTAAVQALKVGNGTEPGTEQGPLIDDAAVRKVEAHVSDAVAKGAAVVAGGKRHALGGSFFEPTIVTGVTTDMQVSSDETFGPLSAISTFDTEDEIVARANDTDFGLAGYFFTRDLGRTFRVAAALKFGLLGVNEGIITTEAAPFGGMKDSGFGREGSHYGCDDYVDIKYVNIGGI